MVRKKKRYFRAKNMVKVSTAKNLNKHFQRKANTLHTSESTLIHPGAVGHSFE